MRRIRALVGWLQDSTETVVRRAISVPAVFLILIAVSAAAPVAIPALIIADLVQRRRLARTRAYLMLWLFAFCDSVGISRAAVISIRYARQAEAYQRANFDLEKWWGLTLFKGAIRIFGIRVTIENPELAEGGPVLVFPRHVSPVDNLLPLYLVSGPHDILLRWVINRWLQRDPCIDIVGHRLPNLFVSTARKSRGEAADVAKLGESLGPTDGVLIFPEGALYTRERHDHVLASLEQQDPALHARALRIEHMLPPRLGGVLGLLDSAEGADVLFVGHYGLEGARRYTSIAWGALVHADLRIKLWRVPAADIPKTAEERTDWLFEWWETMDRWVAGVIAENEGEVPASKTAEA
jgi:hypothetical protein